MTSLEQVITGLKSDTLEMIDFDALAISLDDMRRMICDSPALRVELALMKKDYRDRILGMLKAMLACRHDDSDAETAALLAGVTQEWNAAQLIALYARTAARFRTCFPGSFTYARAQYENGINSWQEHKL